jgi:hypothetical protein
MATGFDPLENRVRHFKVTDRIPELEPDQIRNTRLLAVEYADRNNLTSEQTLQLLDIMGIGD